jgi:hypothetical protein
MSRVGFEVTITALERAKTVHALDGAATVAGIRLHKSSKTVRLLCAEDVGTDAVTGAVALQFAGFLIAATAWYHMLPQQFCPWNQSASGAVASMSVFIP